MNSRAIKPRPTHLRAAWAPLLAAACLWGNTGQAHAQLDPEDAAIYEARLETRTCASSVSKHAGSDGRVTVRLTSYNGDTFTLDRHYDDRETNNRLNTYSVRPGDITYLRDIKRIQLDLSGNDGWCMDWVALYINNQMVFYKSLGSNVVWLDGDSSSWRSYYKIFSSELRSHPYWPKSETSRVCKPPEGLSNWTLETTADSFVGDVLDGLNFPYPVDGIYGRKNPVITRSDHNTFRVELKATASIDWLPDADIRIRTYVDLSCNSNNVSVTSRNSSMDLDSWIGFETAYEFLLDVFAPDVVDNLNVNVSKAVHIPGVDLCPDITLTSEGGMLFDWGNFFGTDISEMPFLCLDL